jgi:hypothetical protein
MNPTILQLIPITEKSAIAILADARLTGEKVYADASGDPDSEVCISNEAATLVYKTKSRKLLCLETTFYTSVPADFTNTYLRSGKWNAEAKIHQRLLDTQHVSVRANARDLLAASKFSFRALPRTGSIGANYFLHVGPDSAEAIIQELKELASTHSLKLADISDTLTDPEDQAQLYKLILADHVILIRKEPRASNRRAVPVPLPKSASSATLPDSKDFQSLDPNLPSPPESSFKSGEVMPMSFKQQLTTLHAWLNPPASILYDYSGRVLESSREQVSIALPASETRYNAALAYLQALNLIQIITASDGSRTITGVN